MKLLKTAKCEIIKDYMKIYLIVDVILLLEGSEELFDPMFEKYKLEPRWFTTTPFLVMAATLLKC